MTEISVTAEFEICLIVCKFKVSDYFLQVRMLSVTQKVI